MAEKFELSLDDFGLPESEMVCVEPNPDWPGLLWGTADAASRPYLWTSDRPDWEAETSLNYLLIGQEGYGANSHSFRYQKIAPGVRVYLRFPYGGVYGDAVEDARCIHNYLIEYLAFEKRAKQAGASFEICEFADFNPAKYRCSVDGRITGEHEYGWMTEVGSGEKSLREIMGI